MASFARFFCPFLKMHRGKKEVLGVIWKKYRKGRSDNFKIGNTSKYAEGKDGGLWISVNR